MAARPTPVTIAASTNSRRFNDSVLPAHDARHREPPHRPDREEQHVHVSARKDRRQDDDDEDVRQRVEHIDRAHHQLIGAPARRSPRSRPTSRR